MTIQVLPIRARPIGMPACSRIDRFYVSLVRERLTLASLLIAILWCIYDVFRAQVEYLGARTLRSEGCVGSWRGCWRSCSDESTYLRITELRGTSLRELYV